MALQWSLSWQSAGPKNRFAFTDIVSQQACNQSSRWSNVPVSLHKPASAVCTIFHLFIHQEIFLAEFPFRFSHAQVQNLHKTVWIEHHLSLLGVPLQAQHVWNKASEPLVVQQAHAFWSRQKVLMLRSRIEHRSRVFKYTAHTWLDERV